MVFCARNTSLWSIALSIHRTAVFSSDGCISLDDETQWNREDEGDKRMNIILWLILFVLCWPIALAALLLYPLIWLLLLPFRLVGITVDAVFQLFKAMITLPARVLAGPRRRLR